MPSNKHLLEIVKELKSDKSRLEKDCEEYTERILEVIAEKKVSSDEAVKQITHLETSLRAKNEALEKQRTENSELKDAVRISKAYVRMLLKEGVTEHRINVVYNIEG